MKLDLALGSPAARLRAWRPATLPGAGLPTVWADRDAAATARQWWADRTARERWLIGVVAAVLALVVLDRLVWAPLLDARTAAADEIARDDRIAARLRAAGPDVARIAAARTGTLPAIVTERAAKAGLTIARIEPQGATVAVSLDGVGFDALIDWLAALDRDAGVSVVELKVDRRPDPGVVTAQVTLSER